MNIRRLQHTKPPHEEIAVVEEGGVVAGDPRLPGDRGDDCRVIADVSARFVQNIKLAEHMVRGTSTTVRAPRLELEGEEKAAVEAIVAAALNTRPDLAVYGF
jgi:hypothetical protein